MGNILGVNPHLFIEDDVTNNLDNYNIPDTVTKLLSSRTCTDFLKGHIYSIVRNIEKDIDTHTNYQLLRDYINSNAAQIIKYYEVHSKGRRYAVSILSILFIEHFSTILKYNIDDVINEIPSYVRHDYVSNYSDKQSVSLNELFNQHKREKTMTTVDSSKAVQQVTFIYGIDAANVTDDNIFEMVRALESKIDNSEKIKNKPKKLKAQIEAYKAEINELVNFVDAR